MTTLERKDGRGARCIRQPRILGLKLLGDASAAEGANIVVAARRKEPLDQLAAELGALRQCPAMSPEKVILKTCSRSPQATYGHVDIAVFSAGIHSGVADLPN